ncbi:MAG: beta-fructosidase [Phormidesmis sp.]
MPFPPQTQQPPRWDPWILQDGASYRLFYLSGRTDQTPWWKTSWICAARSVDMHQWQHLGPVLAPLSDHGWESGRLFAGSTYREADTDYLFYSAAPESDISQEAIGLATSSDGQQWQRCDSPLLSFQDAFAGDGGDRTAAGTRYAGPCNWAGHLHWRDPYVVKEPTTQKYYLFFCASLTGSALYQGGVGLAVAEQLAGPYQLLPPAAGPGLLKAGTDDRSHWPFYHLERPQIIYFQGKYHLFFSCFKEFVNPSWLEKVGPEKITDSTLYWYVCDQITGPFQPVSELPVVLGSRSTGLYGTTFFPLHQQGDWERAAQRDETEMAVLGWYYDRYQLAISQEFRAIWTSSGLEIVGGAIASSQL